MSRITDRPTERMPDEAFRTMMRLFKVLDFVFPYVQRRAQRFGIEKGMTVVDYGCGPGRYSVFLSRIVGPEGRVYSVDIHPLAVKTVEDKARRMGTHNITTVLASGNDEGKYDSKLPDKVAEVVCVIDMFFVIKKPKDFLVEIGRILKDNGVLVIDDGHQSREETKKKILSSGVFEIYEETRDHLKCRLPSCPGAFSRASGGPGGEEKPAQ
jgi:ubiquinone/menaquinone biosynthesis C-methylase UbiE